MCMSIYISKANWMENFPGGDELVTSEYLFFSNSFLNSCIIHSHPHVTHTLDFYFP